MFILLNDFFNYSILYFCLQKVTKIFLSQYLEAFL